ncbi:hypothetical protein Lalb_Chr06g0160671 [Lupinus albus]|uniref:Uncharacterized protein n=1 Tax=Lupinus albus TaxID=3870 RepID=A0A6A4QBP6_LUPAL|nr:hypothetical protein Lalb_Chr06g0160671 [Lupinus albus]
MLHVAKKKRWMWLYLWVVTIWNIWYLKNQIIFENQNFHINEVTKLIHLDS